MLRQWLGSFCLSLLLLAAPVASWSANISGDVRGATLFYLDGGSQDFPWILDNQYNPQVRTRIDNLLANYRAAGVNWIRLLVAISHFPNQGDVAPLPSTALIRKLNDFMAITRAGPNAGQFNIELVLVPSQNAATVEQDKAWFKVWLDNLNYSNLGMVMLGGDLSPCDITSCERTAANQNHANWIRSIWSWKQANYPNLNASFEVIGVDSTNPTNPWLLANSAWWIGAYTPSNPIVAASLYVRLPSGSSWQAYADATRNILANYHVYSAKPLWIDEFGKSLGSSAFGNWSEQDQTNAFNGFLAGSVCYMQNRYPKFAWVAGNDYNPAITEWYGLVSSFSGDTPVFRPAFSAVNLYYNLQACP